MDQVETGLSLELQCPGPLLDMMFAVDVAVAGICLSLCTLRNDRDKILMKDVG